LELSSGGEISTAFPLQPLPHWLDHQPYREKFVASTPPTATTTATSHISFLLKDLHTTK
jgi:hypothetical protein